MKKWIMIAVIATIFLTGCSNSTVKTPLILATTTSTENSGLLAYLLPTFEEKYDREVKVVAVGTGQALEMGKNGEADVLLVHAKDSEIEFVENGYGTERYDVMYNDFILIGPEDQTEVTVGNDISRAYREIAEKELKFISRGDDSGTYTKELGIWNSIGIEPAGEWYISAGKGMGETITMTNEMSGYTLSDRATFLSMKNEMQLGIVVEGDSLLFNQYGVIPVNPEINDKINSEGADEFVEWILSDECQKMIGEFGVDTYGEQLFIPNAQ
ncbi:MAG: substrate-binding domain-containing protein [Lachnospiraceae bacterium]